MTLYSLIQKKVSWEYMSKWQVEILINSWTWALDNFWKLDGWEYLFIGQGESFNNLLPRAIYKLGKEMLGNTCPMGKLEF